MKTYRGYRVTSPYGYRTSPIDGKREFHTGIDLVLSHKAPIKSFTDGTVIHAKFGQSGTGYGGFGNVVAVKDDNGYTHMYAHLDSISVKEGQKIKAGTVVGTQGNTGKSAGSHLHYEVRRKGYGTHVNPTEYLDAYLSAKEQVKGSDDKLQLANYQWDMLVANLEIAYKNKLISDKNWIDLAKSKKLTQSQLIFLNNVLIMRGLKLVGYSD